MGIREVMIEQKVSRERATGQDKEIRVKRGEERTGKDRARQGRSNHFKLS